MIRYFTALIALAIAAGCRDQRASTTEPEPVPVVVTGSLLVSATTTGSDPDPNGFVVTIDGQQPHQLPTTGSVLIAQVIPGSRVVRLTGIANNCFSVEDDTVAVASGQQAAVDFAVPCVARAGTLSVTTTTSGFDRPPNGYLIEVDGGEVSTRVATNGTMDLPAVREGSRVVRIRDVPPQCVVLGANPQTVDVRFRQPTLLAFAARCRTTVTVRLSVTTSGPDQDVDGYEARVEPAFSVPTTAIPIASAGSIEVTVPAEILPIRMHVVLRGVATNCTAAAKGWLGPTAFVEVTSATVNLEYTVSCESIAPKPLPAGGRIAFVRQGGIHLINTDGTGLVELTRGWQDHDPAWSPDGRRIAFVRLDDESDDGGLYVMDANGANLARLARGYALRSPTWSPDGTRIAASGVIDGAWGIAEVNAAGAVRMMVTDIAVLHTPAWSPDGRTLAFVSDRDAWDWGSNVFLSDVSGANITRLTNPGNPISTFPPLFFRPAWAPDGRRLVATGCPVDNQTCETSLIYLVDIGGGQRPLIGARGWSRASWSPDGRTIVYDSGGSLRWIRVDGSDRGLLVQDGHSPAWRP